MAFITAGLNGSFIKTYANAGSFPVSAPAGYLAVDLSTDTLYVFDANTMTWVAIANPGAATAIDGLTGDVSASGPGVVPATVNFVGGSTAANVHAAELLANAATDANTASTIVKRDASGNFTAGTITASLTGHASLDALAARLINTTSPLTGGGNLSADRTIAIPVATSIANGYLSSTDWSTFNSKQAAGNYITALTGDATATGPGSVALTLATVNGNVGSFGSATQVAGFTVNGKGLITAASNTSIQITESQVTNLVSDLAGKQATGNYITALTGDATASGPGSVALTLATVGTAGTFDMLTVNAKGLATSGVGLTTIRHFGDGSDGDVTISSGTTSLTRDMFYHNLTITGGTIKTSGCKIFVSGTLDISSAPASAIRCEGSAGTGGGNPTGGTKGARSYGGTVSVGPPNDSTTGANGAAANGSNAAGFSGVNPSNGGSTTGAGAGGNGSVGTGGTVTTPSTLTQWPVNIITTHLIKNILVINGGQGGQGGAGGGGDNASSTGGGGGGGGGAGGIMYIAAKTINRSGSTTANAINISGAAGGQGGAAVAGNAGGGGGGSGGGGGWLYLAYQTLTGSTATNCINLSGGAGGNGGNAQSGTATGGDGGGSGGTGMYTIFNLGAGTTTYATGGTGTAGGAHSGTTGGTGASANTLQLNL